ncbi:hypothetical protein QOT17_005195 [Balamuthia mandrillaris]
MNDSYKTCGSSSLSLPAFPPNGGSCTLVFSMSRVFCTYKAYLGDTKIFLAKPGASWGLPCYTLYDGSKANVLAYAKRYSSILNGKSPKWEVRRGGKHGPPIAKIKNKGKRWWVSMGENTTDDLRIDKHSLRSTLIIKNGVTVARFAQKKWYKSNDEFCMCVSNEE